jgi:DTW domain-containing protein YfiP
MVKRSDPLKDAQPGDREECYACRRVKKNCLCGSIKPFSTRTRFVILMHSEEAHKQRTGTARLAKMCLKNAELIAGADFTNNERVNSMLRDTSYSPFVLYPGPDAANFKTLGKDHFSGKTLLVFVIDGTWGGARSLLNRSRNLRALPRLSFSRSYVSRFVIKRQPMAHCVSTIEAIYYLCKEAEEAGYEKPGAQAEALMVPLKKLVETQLHYRKVEGRRREDSSCLK